MARETWTSLFPQDTTYSFQSVIFCCSFFGSLVNMFYEFRKNLGNPSIYCFLFISRIVVDMFLHEMQHVCSGSILIPCKCLAINSRSHFIKENYSPHCTIHGQITMIYFVCYPLHIIPKSWVERQPLLNLGNELKK